MITERQRKKKKLGKGLIKTKYYQIKRYIAVMIYVFKFIWKNTIGRIIGEEWIFLTLTGILAGTLSFTIDRTIGICNSCKPKIYTI